MYPAAVFHGIVRCVAHLYFLFFIRLQYIFGKSSFEFGEYELYFGKVNVDSGKVNVDFGKVKEEFALFLAFGGNFILF